MEAPASPLVTVGGDTENGVPDAPSALVRDHKTLADIVRRVDIEALADQFVTRFRAAIPGYQRLPEAVVTGAIRGIAHENIDLFFNSILENRSITDEELEAFRASATQRATEGMPLEDLLHAYRLGGRLGWQAISEAALPQDRDALLSGADMLMVYVDRVSSVVAQAYLDERQHLVSEEERRLRDLVEALIADEPVDVALRELAERLGFPIADFYRPFAQTVAGAAAREHSRLAGALRMRGVLALTEGERITGLVPEGVEVVKLVEPGAVYALGESTPRSDLGAALEEMRLLVDLGARMERTGQVHVEELLPELLLARSPRLAASLCRRVLGPLLEYDARRSSDLVQTLRGFINSELDRRRTAHALHVHPNTLAYRLRRIEDLTGLDVGRPGDLALVVLAVKQQALTDQPPA